MHKIINKMWKNLNQLEYDNKRIKGDTKIGQQQQLCKETMTISELSGCIMNSRLALM